jgi:hypothetical protein
MESSLLHIQAYIASTGRLHFLCYCPDRDFTM